MNVDQFLMLADDWLKIVVSVLFAVFYLVAQLMSGREQAKKRRPPPKPRLNPPPAAPAARMAGGRPQGAPPKKPNGLEESLRREVDEFLRRAQGKPAPQKAEPKRPQRPKLTPTSELGAPAKQAEQARREGLAHERKTPQPLPSQQSRKTPLAPVPTPAPAGKASPWGSGVGEHVAEHLAAGRVSSHAATLTSHAEHLGDTLAQTDERMAAHVHEVFDHQLGSLAVRADAQPATAKKRPSIAADVVELIRKPGGMRQLIIANEILRRPGERF